MQGANLMAPSIPGGWRLWGAAVPVMDGVLQGQFTVSLTTRRSGVVWSCRSPVGLERFLTTAVGNLGAPIVWLADLLKSFSHRRLTRAATVLPPLVRSEAYPDAVVANTLSADLIIDAIRRTGLPSPLGP